MPVAYAREHLVPKDRACLVVTFEYGPKKPGDERPSSSMPGRDVFRQARTPFAPGNGDWVGVSEFLHPVFRFRESTTHHTAGFPGRSSDRLFVCSDLPEDLENATRSAKFVA